MDILKIKRVINMIKYTNLYNYFHRVFDGYRNISLNKDEQNLYKLQLKKIRMLIKKKKKRFIRSYHVKILSIF